MSASQPGCAARTGAGIGRVPTLARRHSHGGIRQGPYAHCPGTSQLPECWRGISEDSWNTRRQAGWNMENTWRGDRLYSQDYERQVHPTSSLNVTTRVGNESRVRRAVWLCHHETHLRYFSPDCLSSSTMHFLFTTSSAFSRTPILPLRSVSSFFTRSFTVMADDPLLL